MKRMIRCFWLIMLTLMAVVIYAQDPAPTAFVMQVDDGGNLELGEVDLPGPSLAVDWNPRGSDSWARVDNFGILRLAPIGSPEGVYSFSPYFDGYTTDSREDNRLFVAEVDWSPDGQQLAFRISSGHTMGNDGVWFWQPAMETATDPSYHLLRDCPPGCNLVNARDTTEWKSLSMDWAPDNVAILVHLYLPEEERHAIGVVFASRDSESPQADIQPPTYRYEYGSWTADGENLVVSGYGPEDDAVYGIISRDGSIALVDPISDIGLAYARNAVQHPDTRQLLMLASPESDTVPVAIYDEDGTALTSPIGTTAPDHVVWSPDRNAVLVQIDDQSYVATIDGAVYEITDIVEDNPIVNWVEADFPEDTTMIDLPEPEEIQPTATPVVITIPAETAVPDEAEEDRDSQSQTAPQTEFEVGQLLQVAVDSVTLYTEPFAGAEEVATLEQGEALVIVGGPLTDGDTIWWRIQTLDYIGWAEEVVNGETQFST